MTPDESKRKAKRQRDNWKRRALEWRQIAWRLCLAYTEKEIHEARARHFIADQKYLKEISNADTQS